MEQIVLYIGRDKSNDIVIDNQSISRQHASVTFINGEYRIQDNKSLNGVFINGNKVDSAIITTQDFVSLGTTEPLTWLKIYQAFENKSRSNERVYGAKKQSNTKLTISIGRNVDNDLVISEPSVSNHHALVHYSMLGNPNVTGGWRIVYMIEDLNSANGVFVNGRKITRSEITSHDIVTLGSKINLEWDVIEKAIARKGQQAKLHGSMGNHLSNPEISIRIGRNRDNDIIIDSPEVSRAHAAIDVSFENGTQYMSIRDLGSQNGTFVNDSPCQGSVNISGGDTICIGTSQVLSWDQISSAIMQKMNKENGSQIDGYSGFPVTSNETSIGYPNQDSSQPYLYETALNQYTDSDMLPPAKKTNVGLTIGLVASVLIVIAVGAFMLLKGGQNQQPYPQSNKVINYVSRYQIKPGEPQDIAKRRAKIEAQRELLEKAKESFPNNNDFATNYAIFSPEITNQSYLEDEQVFITDISAQMSAPDFEAKMDYINTHQDIYDRLEALQNEYDANYSLVGAAESNMIQSYQTYQESGMNQSGYSTDYEPANNPDYSQGVISSAEQYYNDCVSTYMEQLDGVEQSIVHMDEPRIALHSIKSETKIAENRKPSLFDRVANMFSGAVSSMFPSSGPVDALIAWKSTADRQSMLQFYETKHGSRALAAKWYPEYAMDAEANEAIKNLVQQMDLESSNIEKLKKSDFQVEYYSGDIARITIKNDAIERISRGSSAIMDRAVDAGLEGGLEYLRRTDPEQYAEKVKEKEQFSEKLRQEMRDDLGGDLYEIWKEAWENTVYYMIKEGGKWKRYLYNDDSELQKLKHFENLLNKLNDKTHKQVYPIYS